MNDASGRRGPERGSASNVRNLADAIRKVRLAEAERADVVVELRDTERARLEMLVEALEGVFAEVPEGDDQFVAAIDTGSQPRFWIDMTAFVSMARDRRTYRFLKDTRLGRTVILETADLDDMADCVMHYVAERVIERERALEGDWLIQRAAQQDARPGRRTLGRQVPESQPVTPPPARANTGWIVSAFLGGLLLGVIGLFAYAWVHVGG
ncbi:hypothetical protein K32_33020 [Kaistia sp. 32K]|uniref:hypothetical protein n=1 Tax=Kaistia sp. 32K TaxID=2795690 RepID=UPI001915B4D2|nr:hypothetical protein [Kaistia sp. 32K]BCP54685.1 hypothetical protein K32_33020 [Kaistia sp. 32K]